MERITLTKGQPLFSELRWLVQAVGEDGRYALHCVGVSGGGRKYDATDGARLHRLTVESAFLGDGVYLIKASAAVITIDKVDAKFPDADVCFNFKSPIRAEGEFNVVSDPKKPDKHPRGVSSAVGSIMKKCFGDIGFRVDFIQNALRPLNGKFESDDWKWEHHEEDYGMSKPLLLTCETGSVKRQALIMPYKADM